MFLPNLIQNLVFDYIPTYFSFKKWKYSVYFALNNKNQLCGQILITSVTIIFFQLGKYVFMAWHLLYVFLCFGKLFDNYENKYTFTRLWRK